MKILHLVNTVGGRGNGIVHVAVDLAVAQAQEGHEVYIAGAKGAYADHMIRHGVHFVELRLVSSTRLPSTRAVLRVGSLVRQQGIEIIHAHNMSGAVIGRLAAILNKPFGRGRVRVITTVHNSWASHARLMRIGHRVIAVTKAVGDEMIRKGIPPKKIAVVVNGPIGTTRSSEEHAPVEPVTMQHPSVLSVAGMYERKGIRDIIDATVLLRERVPNVKVYLAGDGPDRPIFEAYARERGVDQQVVFLGFRPDAHDLMRQANVFVLASHAEPAALVIAEARNAGVPVVATNAGGMPEMLDQGRAGELFPPRDSARLAEILARILLDPAVAADLARRAREGIEWFHVDRMSRETVNVYREALTLT